MEYEEFGTTSEADIRSRSYDPEKTVIIGMPDRLGVKGFIVQLEHRLFPPADARQNDLFELFIMKWQEILWMVVSIPREYEGRARELAKEHGVKLADGIPMTFGDLPFTVLLSNRPSEATAGQGLVGFPVDGPRAFTLENTRESVAYDGPSVVEEALRKEGERIGLIIDSENNRN